VDTRPDLDKVEGPVRLVHRVRVVSAVRVREVSVAHVRVVVRVAPVDPVVVRAPVVVRVVRVAARARRDSVAPRAVVAVVVAKKSCSPARFATPSRPFRFLKASSSSSAVCRPRNSHRA